MGTELKIAMADYVGGFGSTRATAQNLYDQWQEISVVRILRNSATGFLIRIDPDDVMALNELFYVDDISLIGPRFTQPQAARRGDSIKIAWPNSEAIEYGLEVIWQAA